MSGVPVVLVPGAFRGAWMWERVTPLLAAAGLDPRPVDLPGRPGERPPSMADWVGELVATCDRRPRSTVVVGHSMGGVVAQACTGHTDRIRGLVLLDAPIVRTGQRAVDVSGGSGAPLPPADLWIEPRPVGANEGFVTDELATWVNQRLAPTPVRPSLDELSVDDDVPRTVVFFDRTPSFFPSARSRATLDAEGGAYVTVDTHHDGPLLVPDAVASAIVEAVRT